MPGSVLFLHNSNITWQGILSLVGTQQIFTTCHVPLPQLIIGKVQGWRSWSSRSPKASGVRCCLKWNSTFCAADPSASHTADSSQKPPSQKPSESRAWRIHSGREDVEAASTTQLLPWAMQPHTPPLVPMLLCVFSLSDQLVLCPEPELQRKFTTYTSRGRIWESALVPYRVT
jgi:hypothetical protein